MGEAELFGFGDALVRAESRAHFPAQADFAKNDEIFGEFAPSDGRSDGKADGEIGGGIIELESTDDINKDIFIIELEFGAALDDGDEKVETVKVKARGGALGVAEIGGGDKGLDFDEDGACAFESGKNDGAISVLAFGK